jgi:hypothetical protein
MTLSVHAFVPGEPELHLTPSPPHNDLFGVQALLRTWIELGRRHGLPLFRRLEESLPVVFGPDELAALEGEVRHLADAVATDDDDHGSLAFRVANLLEAIRLARSTPGACVEIG